MKENIDEEEEINTNSIKKEEDKEEEKNKEKKENNKEKIKDEEKEKFHVYDLEEKNNEFDENIFFNHYYLAQRQMEVEPVITGRAFPYIMSREFLYSYFEDKKNYKVGGNETYPQILGRVKQFMNSNDDNFNKIFFFIIISYTEKLGREKSETIIIPVLSKIVEDKINTKIYFLKILRSYIEYLYNLGKEGIEIIKNNIFNVIEEMYRIKFNPQLSNVNKKYIVTEEEQKQYDLLLFERFVQIAQILIKTNLKDYVLDVINNYGKDDKDEKNIEKKRLSIKLLTHLSVDFGEEFTKKNILPIIDKYIMQENIEIMEETTLSFITLIKLLNIDFIGDYALESLQKISHDKFWVTRKKCIEVLCKIIYELKNKYKKENNEYYKTSEYVVKFIKLIEIFIEDKKKKVRMFLIEKISEIIKPLDVNELSEKLLDFYMKTIEEYYENADNLLNLENKIKMNYYFASNFQTVLLKYKTHWEKLQKILDYLCKDEDINVREIIISSFYDISTILGKEITQNNLLPLYNKFLQCEKCNNTRILAEKHLPKILSGLDKNIREKYLKNNNIGYNSIISQEKNIINKLNINTKLDYLNNILTYFTLYEKNYIYNDLLPKCIYFSFDRIYKVRSTSSKIIGILILHLYQKEYKKEKLFQILETYAFHKKMQQRINFVKICQSILLVDNTLYNEKLKNLLFTIAIKEYNFNVLIAMAKSLKKIVLKEDSVCGKESSIHYLCKKVDNGKISTIDNMFKDVTLQKNEKLEEVGEIPEGEVFVKDNSFFKEEFDIEINMKKENINDNIINDNDDIKYIN